MTEVRITPPAQAMADLSLDTPTPRARERLEVPPMEPMEEDDGG